MSQFVTVLCWIGVAQSVLLGIFFVTSRRDQTSLLLGLMFLAIGLRVTKSILFLTLDETPAWLINIGFASHACVAPLLFLYLRSLTKSENSYLLISFYFLIPLVIVLLSGYITLDGFWYKGGYGALLYYTLIYLVLCWYYYARNRDRLAGSSIPVQLIAVSIFQIAYFSNYILMLTPYEAGPVLHSIMVYVISFMVLRSNDLMPGSKKKYTNLKISDDQLSNYTQRVFDIMTSQQPYLDPDFSLAQLSKLTNIPAHVLSYVFTSSIKKNFQLFTNSYRIEAAKQRLTDPAKKHFSIAAIAEECGFNSISSFNTAFKKIAGQTPSEFRNA